MNEKMNDIITMWENKEITTEEANKQLAAYGIVLDPENVNWDDDEIKEGFNKGEEPKDVPNIKDFQTRRMEFAGHTIRVKTKQGTYDVTYKPDGYHLVSKLV